MDSILVGDSILSAARRPRSLRAVDYLRAPVRLTRDDGGASREAERKRIEGEVARFLRAGGEIKQCSVERSVVDVGDAKIDEEKRKKVGAKIRTCRAPIAIHINRPNYKKPKKNKHINLVQRAKGTHTLIISGENYGIFTDEQIPDALALRQKIRYERNMAFIPLDQ